MRKATLLTFCMVCISLGWVGRDAAAESGGNVARAEMELKQAYGLLTELLGEVRELEAQGFTFIPAERFIDAMVYFDLKHYEKAALLFTSLVEDDRFRRDKNYFEAVKLLGICQFNEGNYQGAHRQFETLVAAGAYREVSTTYLVEIAAKLGRTQELRQLGAAISAQSASSGLLYAKGKALYFTGQYDGAIDVLKAVAGGAAGMKAQYISGASLVALRRFEDASRVFEGLLKGEPTSDDEKELYQLANLALGRLSYEAGDFSAAADYYQQIPRQSDYFEQALYEVTHVHLRWALQRTDVGERMRSYGKAEEILDILVSITKDPELSRDARTLRGRISMFLEKYELAREAYQEVIDLFASTSSELTDLAQSPENVDRFFVAMIKGGDASKQLSLFVSEEVVNWMRAQPTLGRVVEMLSDVASQRDALNEAQTIYKQLTYSLSQQAARELFPGFSDAWLKSLEIENRLLLADHLLLEAEKDFLKSSVGGADKAKLQQLASQREKLEKKLASAPRTVGGYKARSRHLMTRLKVMAKDADEQVLRIEKIREQVVAMQKLLKEVKYKGSTMLKVKDEAAISGEIEKEGNQLLSLLKQAKAMRSDIEKEMLVAEVGDQRSQSEQGVKAQLWKHHGEEAAFYIDLAEGLDADVRKFVDEANTLRRQILDSLGTVRSQQAEIDRKAQKQIKYYKGVLREEQKLLRARETELAATEKVAMRFARDVGSALFLDAKEKLVKAVIEADLGLVDLSWHRTQVETDRIEEIQAERARVVDRLRTELRAVAGEEPETEEN